MRNGGNFLLAWDQPPSAECVATAPNLYGNRLERACNWRNIDFTYITRARSPLLGSLDFFCVCMSCYCSTTHYISSTHQQRIIARTNPSPAVWFQFISPRFTHSFFLVGAPRIMIITLWSTTDAKPISGRAVSTLRRCASLNLYATIKCLFYWIESCPRTDRAMMVKWKQEQSSIEMISIIAQEVLYICLIFINDVILNKLKCCYFIIMFNPSVCGNRSPLFWPERVFLQAPLGHRRRRRILVLPI